MAKLRPDFIAFDGQWVRRNLIERIWSQGHVTFLAIGGVVLEESGNSSRTATNREIELKYLCSEVVE